MKFGITHKTLLFATVAVMFLFSASLLLMPISVQLSFRGKTALMLINGAWFWLGGIASVILFVITNMKREKKADCGGVEKFQFGIFKFFTNKWAKIADFTLLGSLSASIILISVQPQGWLIFVSAFLTVFSFLMHCVLNGENFKCVMDEMNSDKTVKTGKEEKKQ